MMKKQILLSDLSDWEAFEDLVASYFTTLQVDGVGIETKVMPSGKGPDEGRDILVSMRTNDGIASFERRWVVQCKFYVGTVHLSNLNSVNIPTLVHSYNAVGYLLVVREGVSSGVINTFERLRKECAFKYLYEVWTGSMFQEKLYSAPRPLLRQYFPEYQAFIDQLECGGAQ